MRTTERLPASWLLLGLVPRPAGVTPWAAIGDRGRWAKENALLSTSPQPAKQLAYLPARLGKWNEDDAQPMVDNQPLNDGIQINSWRSTKESHTKVR